MTKQPLVSIITPSYNQAKYLEATLQSVLRQDYPRLEYLVVDGGSSDGSKELIQRYQDRLAWWVSEPDQGQADAINKGFARARGEILAWLNSDDLYLPGTITAAVRAFLTNPDVGVVYGDAVSADEEGRLLNEMRFAPWGLADLLQFKIICQPAVFFRREILEGAGYLDPTYHFYLDHSLWIRMARLARFHHVPQIWAVTRYHQEAKNLTLAVSSGKEVHRILDWAAEQPDLSILLEEHQSRIKAGSEQIIARYLLDGGEPARAFRHYLQAFRARPASIRGYWHRWLFAGLATLGLDFLGKWYYCLKRKIKPALIQEADLAGWPGLEKNWHQ